jgi:hypothetical protein
VFARACWPVSGPDTIMAARRSVSFGLVDHRDEAGAVGNIQLAVDAFEVFVHGALADRKATGNLTIGDPTEKVFDDLALACGER